MLGQVCDHGHGLRIRSLLSISPLLAMIPGDTWTEVKKRLSVIHQINMFEEGANSRVLPFVRAAVRCCSSPG